MKSSSIFVSTSRSETAAQWCVQWQTRITCRASTQSTWRTFVQSLSSKFSPSEKKYCMLWSPKWSTTSLWTAPPGWLSPCSTLKRLMEAQCLRSNLLGPTSARTGLKHSLKSWRLSLKSNFQQTFQSLQVNKTFSSASSITWAILELTCSKNSRPNQK